MSCRATTSLSNKMYKYILLIGGNIELLSAALSSSDTAAACIDMSISTACKTNTGDIDPWLTINTGAFTDISQIVVTNTNGDQNQIVGATVSIMLPGNIVLWNSSFVGAQTNYVFYTQRANITASSHFKADCDNAVGHLAECNITTDPGYFGGSMACDTREGTYKVIDAVANTCRRATNVRNNFASYSACATINSTSGNTCQAVCKFGYGPREDYCGNISETFCNVTEENPEFTLVCDDNGDFNVPNLAVMTVWVKLLGHRIQGPLDPSLFNPESVNFHIFAADGGSCPKPGPSCNPPYTCINNGECTVTEGFRESCKCGLPGCGLEPCKSVGRYGCNEPCQEAEASVKCGNGPGYCQEQCDLEPGCLGIDTKRDTGLSQFYKIVGEPISNDKYDCTYKKTLGRAACQRRSRAGTFFCVFSFGRLDRHLHVW